MEPLAVYPEGEEGGGKRSEDPDDGPQAGADVLDGTHSRRAGTGRDDGHWNLESYRTKSRDGPENAREAKGNRSSTIDRVLSCRRGPLAHRSSLRFDRELNKLI